MDCIVQGVTKSQTRLSNVHFHSTPKAPPNFLCPSCDNSILPAVQAQSLGVDLHSCISLQIHITLSTNLVGFAFKLYLACLLPTFSTVVHISLDYGISPPFSLLLPWTPVGSSQISSQCASVQRQARSHHFSIQRPLMASHVAQSETHSSHGDHTVLTHSIPYPLHCCHCPPDTLVSLCVQHTLNAPAWQS